MDVVLQEIKYIIYIQHAIKCVCDSVDVSVSVTS